MTSIEEDEMMSEFWYLDEEITDKKKRIKNIKNEMEQERKRMLEILEKLNVSVFDIFKKEVAEEYLKEVE